MSRGILRVALSVALVWVASIATPAHAGGVLMASPSSMSFGNVQVGEISTPQTVNVWNSGDAPVVISSVTPTGSGASSFTISNDTCSGQTVPHNSIGCSFNVRFAPSAAGGRSATVAISSNGTPSRLDVAVDGTGTNPTLMGPASLEFGFSVEVGRSSDVVQANFFNNGYGPVTIGTASIVGTSASQFSITQDGCSSASLPQSGFCSMSLRFTPSSTGDKLAELRLPSSATNSPNVVALTGRGHLAIQVFPSTYQFSPEAVGRLSATTLHVNVYNGSVNPYRIDAVSVGGAHPGDFPIGDSCSGQTLQSNGSCSISVGFRPTAPGARTASISLTTNAPGGAPSVSLGGTGLAPAVVVNPNPVSYGVVELGTSALRTITIRNDGDGTALVNSVSLSGAYFFEESATCSGANLFPNGGSCSFAVRYVPSALGAHAGTVTVNTSGGVTDVALTGTAVDTTAPQTAIDEAALPVKASLLTSVTGTATDAGGVDGTTLVFEDALGNRTVTTPSLVCGAGNRSCSWSVQVPVLLPGSYTVRAFSRDRNGNLESPGDLASMVIV